MGLLGLLTFPVTAPLSGALWVAKQLTEQAEKEFFNEDTVRGQLMELELRFELGEVSEEAFNEAEETLLARLRYIRERNKPEEE
jgi:hypothetical protein